MRRKRFVSDVEELPRFIVCLQEEHSIRGGKDSGYHAPHKGRPGQVGGSRPRESGGPCPRVVNLFDRQDRQDGSRVKFRAEDVEDHLDKYPAEALKALSKVEIIVASDQFLREEIKGCGCCYHHNTVWLSNTFLQGTGRAMLDHEVGHALVEKFGPPLAVLWHDMRGTYLRGVAEEDCCDEFGKFIAGESGTVWEQWFSRQRQRAGKGSGYHAPYYGRPGEIGGSSQREDREEGMVVGGERALRQEEEPLGCPGKPLPAAKPPFATEESTEHTVEWWREVMPERYKGFLDATLKELGD